MRLNIVVVMTVVAWSIAAGASSQAAVTDVTVVRKETVVRPWIHAAGYGWHRTYGDCPCRHRPLHRHYHASRCWGPVYRSYEYRTYIGVAGYPKFYGLPYDDEDFDFYGHY